MTDAVEVLRIDSLEDERLDAYLRLTERELRCVLEPQKGIFIAESAKVIERVVRAPGCARGRGSGSCVRCLHGAHGAADGL